MSYNPDAALAGSSPHTRGALFNGIKGVISNGIIPAYAGSTSIRFNYVGDPRDHPRIRGEHVIIEGTAYDPLGSSPHTRGAPLGILQQGDLPGIIPAYAGSTKSIQSLDT